MITNTKVTIDVDDNTPVSMLTVGQLRKALFPDIEKAKTDTSKPSVSEKRYVYGLAGIRGLFNVSVPTAHRLKNTVLKGAISQQGRVIVCDVEKAMQLFRENSSK
jgi:hypothetical protein